MKKGEIVAGWIAPHGVVSDMPAPQLAQVPKTDAGMRAAAERMMSLGVDTVILVAPHGFRAPDANTVSVCRHNAVQLNTWYPWRDDELRFPGDRELGLQIVDAARARELSVVGLIYGATTESAYPMDWSITAPMRYLQDAGYQGSLVPVTFSTLPLEHEWQFGQAIAEAVSGSSKRVGFIASSDLSHVHSDQGPYGCDPIASEYDAWIETAVAANDLHSLAGADLEWVAKAAQDGLRSILTMGGAIEGQGFGSEVVAYEVLIYFGMLTAWFGR